MDPRYPIGRFDVNAQQPIVEAIEEIRALPAKLRTAAIGLSERQLETAYREGGWTARQVIHHVADSHMNSYVRFRLALTEERPTIKPYDEKKWAELVDAKSGPVEESLELVESLHARWARLLEAMKPEDFERVFVHPERGEVTLAVAARMYAWHGRHHLGHLGIVARGGA